MGETQRDFVGRLMKRPWSPVCSVNYDELHRDRTALEENFCISNKLQLKVRHPEIAIQFERNLSRFYRKSLATLVVHVDTRFL